MQWAERNDRIVLRYAGTAAPTLLEFRIGVLPPGADQIQTISQQVATFTVDGTVQVEPATERVSESGQIVFANVTATAVGVDRGEFYCRLIVGDFAATQGYVYEGFSLSLGFFEESTSGRGVIKWIQDGNDVAGNSDSTVNLAGTNVLRLHLAFLVKYHADGNTASRQIVLRLRDVGDTSGPTGFAIDADVWESPTLTLTANEEGIVYVAEGFESLNDNGTIALSDQSTTPNPLPLMIEEGDTADVIVDITNGLAGDDYDVFRLVEEWIDI